MANISQIKLPDNSVYQIKDLNAGVKPIIHFESGGIYLNNEEHGMIFLSDDELSTGSLEDGQIIFIIIAVSLWESDNSVFVYYNNETFIPVYLGNTTLKSHNLTAGLSFTLIYSSSENKFYAFGLPIVL